MPNTVSKNIYAKGLTDLESRFIDEYFLCAGNATDAAKKVCKTGTKWPGQAARRLMDRPRVKAEIARRRAILDERSIATVARIEEELSVLGFSNAKDLFKDGKLIPIAELPDHVSRAIASIEMKTNEDGDVVTKVRWWGKPDALNMLGRIRGMFVDTVHLKTDFADRLVRARERATRR